jgi:hypothetical protein
MDNHKSRRLISGNISGFFELCYYEGQTGVTMESVTCKCPCCGKEYVKAARHHLCDKRSCKRHKHEDPCSSCVKASVEAMELQFQSATPLSQFENKPFQRLLTDGGHKS